MSHMYHVLPSGNSAGCSGLVDQFPSRVLLMQEMRHRLRSLLGQALNNNTTNLEHSEIFGWCKQTEIKTRSFEVAKICQNATRTSYANIKLQHNNISWSTILIILLLSFVGSSLLDCKWLQYVVVCFFSFLATYRTCCSLSSLCQVGTKLRRLFPPL